MSNSIIEAQEELKIQQELELKRCIDDPHYFYLNYVVVKTPSKEIKFFKTDLDRNTFNRFEELRRIKEGTFINLNYYGIRRNNLLR